MSFSWSFVSLNVWGKKTRKEEFLEIMDEILPWEEFLKVISPYWYNKKLWRKKTDALLMLKIHFLQKWYHLADLSVEEAIWENIVFQKFLDRDPWRDGVPDATTIENFRYCLESNSLSEQLFQTVLSLLSSRGLILQEGSSVDASIIAAPSSTKNKDKKRDPEMKQTRKWNQWHFWMKLHCGTDTRNKIIHTLKTSSANEHDSKYFEDCLHGKEKVVFADKAYDKKERVKQLREKWICVKIHCKAKKWKKLSRKQEYENKKRSSVRSKCEHPFHIIKNIFWWKKVIYKWLKKNTEHFYTVCALANIYTVRKQIHIP